MPFAATIATLAYTSHAITATPAYHGLANLLPISLPHLNSLFTSFLYLSHIIHVIFRLFTAWKSTANAVNVS
jgi:hypothetical protein